MTARSSDGARPVAVKKRGARKNQHSGGRARKIITVICNDDGRCYTAANATKLITGLRNFSFGEFESDRDWMQQIAERTRLRNATRISTANAERFIASLIRACVLTEVPRYTTEQDPEGRLHRA
jgi:hypothetical protein